MTKKVKEKMISVIIPESKEAELTVENVQKELDGLHYELIIDDWNHGLSQSQGEFLIFLEDDCVWKDGSLRENIEFFNNNPTYRKLAMVSPSVGLNSWDNKIFGFTLGNDVIFPLKHPFSQEPHFVQSTYIPGAVIRRFAIEDHIAPFSLDIVMDSMSISTSFWKKGSRCILNPNTTYVSTREDLGEVIHVELPDMLEVRKLWKRELIR